VRARRADAAGDRREVGRRLRAAATALAGPDAASATVKVMAKTWVLDTETKGTGAHMVPLEKLLRRASEEHDLATFTFKREPEPAVEREPDPAPAPRFRVVDVFSGRELGRDVDVRATVGLLEGRSSVLDSRVYVWVPSSERWRLLTLDEHKLLWRYRGSV
jgi:hypothetical protein